MSSNESSPKKQRKSSSSRSLLEKPKKSEKPEKPEKPEKSEGKSNKVKGKSSTSKESKKKSSKKEDTKEKEISKILSLKKPRNDSPILNDDVWYIIKEYFDRYNLLHHQIESYNDFIQRTAQDIINNLNTITVNEGDHNYTVKFGELTFDEPCYKETNGDSHTLYPMDALRRNASYVSCMYIDINITHPNNNLTVHNNVYLGDMPIMKGSVLCSTAKYKNSEEDLIKFDEDITDQGGYFIIAPKGEGNQAQRRILVPQEKTSNNVINVFNVPRKHVPKYDTHAEIKSIVCGVHMTNTIIGTLKGEVSAVIPWIESIPIPIGVIFNAMGVLDTEKILFCILGNDWKKDKNALEILNKSLEKSNMCKSQEQALYFIGIRGKKFVNKKDKKEEDENINDVIDDYDEEKDKKEKKDEQNNRESSESYARHIINNEYLSHLGQGEEFIEKKIVYTGLAVKRLLDVKLGREKPVDRDHYGNKLISLAGPLLAQQFYCTVKRISNEISSNTKNHVGQKVNILSWIKSSTMTNSMTGCISNNSWGSKGNSNKGVSQLYEQFNLAASVANARKVSIQLSADGGGKVIAPRDVHGSHWGGPCPSETPEGKKCGLIKNLSLICYITIGYDPTPLKELVLNHIIHFGDKSIYTYRGIRVFVNGDILGYVNDPHSFINEIKSMRRNGNINYETSVIYKKDLDEIRISTEPGRISRPLFIIEKGKLVITKNDIENIQNGTYTWIDLIQNGLVEFIDKIEEESTLVICYPEELEEMEKDKRLKYTHCEFHPSLIYGVGGSLIPFPDHNQSPRNCYQAAMGKQGMGIPFTNYRQIMHGTFHVLRYPERPLNMTRASKVIGYDKLPSGQNAMTVIMPRVYNEEDSIEINKASVERGFMVSDKYIAYYIEVREDKKEEFRIPNLVDCNNFKANTSKLMKSKYERFELQSIIELIKKKKLVKYITDKKDKTSLISILEEKRYENYSKQDLHRKLKRRGLSQNGDQKTLIKRLLEYRECYVKRGIKVENGDVILAKIIKNNDTSSIGKKKPFNSESIIYEHQLPGRIDSILKGTTNEGYPFIRICVVQPRYPIEADKFAARHGQKGTVGSLTPEEDLPFISNGPMKGLKADLYVNSLAFPSRMTIAMLIELLLGLIILDPNFNKILLEQINGFSMHPDYKNLVDATPFRKFDIKKIVSMLHELGITNCGDVQMTDGITGEVMECLIFYGPVYYQKLKHMVWDKIHARAQGGLTTVARQPKEGRQVGGGLRVGVQEKECLLANGLAFTTKDRLCENSDEYKTHVCDICGLLVANSENGCPVCQNNEISKIKIPYGAKLITQELMGMNIVPRVFTRPLKEEK